LESDNIHLQHDTLHVEMKSEAAF